MKVLKLGGLRKVNKILQNIFLNYLVSGLVPHINNRLVPECNTGCSGLVERASRTSNYNVKIADWPQKAQYSQPNFMEILELFLKRKYKGQKQLKSALHKET